MAIARFLWQNHGTGGTWDSGSQVATLPACNLGDENRNRVWRSTGAGTSDWVRLKMATTALAVDLVGFVSANFTSCASIVIEADCASCLNSASAFTTCFAPWNAARSNVVFAELSSRQTKLWWRFIVCDTGVDEGYYQVGVVPLGKATCMNIGVQEITYRIVDPSLVEYAPSGTPKTWALSVYSEVDMPHRFVSEAMVFDTYQDVARSFARRAEGILSVFSTAPACSTAALALNLYGRFVEAAAFRYTVPGFYETAGPMTFRESR